MFLCRGTGLVLKSQDPPLTHLLPLSLLLLGHLKLELSFTELLSLLLSGIWGAVVLWVMG